VPKAQLEQEATLVLLVQRVIPAQRVTQVQQELKETKESKDPKV